MKSKLELTLSTKLSDMEEAIARGDNEVKLLLKVDPIKEIIQKIWEENVILPGPTRALLSRRAKTIRIGKKYPFAEGVGRIIKRSDMEMSKIKTAFKKRPSLNGIKEHRRRSLSRI